jgi:DNA-binding Lrp family transcriptional regulator
MSDLSDTPLLDEIDRALVRAAQAGLPLTAQPYHALGERIGISADEVMLRLTRMLEAGMIRRIGAVPNHYALGYRANGMSVWDVADDQVDALGRQIGSLECVSHCYLRPRRLPQWRYNLFAMLHGHDRIEVQAQVERIATMLGAACRAHTVLFSTRILKKTGLRI